MKKTLLAAAALVAVSGSALAQSSVTLYGVVDASLENVKAGSTSLTRVSSDNLATSRLGFKGTEDLGGGLKANFVLEHNVKVDTGAQGNAPRFWDRASWVGLAGSFGDIRLGRIDSSIGALAGNSAILGAQSYDDLRIANTWASNKYRRVDNSITYYLPSLVQGLTVQFQYALAGVGTNSAGAYDNTAVGSETTNVDTGKAFGFSAQYALGAWGAGAGYIESKANAAGSYKDSAALAYGSYDFGYAKVIGYYNVDSRSTKAARKEVLGLKAVVPYTKDFSVSFGLSQVRNAKNSASATVKDDALIAAIKATYSLSKRTALYGLVTAIDNDAGADLAVGGLTGTAGKASHGIAFGVRHQF